MVNRTPPNPPANYWATMIGLASLALGALNMVVASSKADREDVRQQERRMCRLEAAAGKGDCGR